jgi:hypothetical protein
MGTTDQNGRAVQANVQQESDGTWGANVWVGSGHFGALTLRRYYYETRTAARNADISDEPGKRGCVACGGQYEDADGIMR